MVENQKAAAVSQHEVEVTQTQTQTQTLAVADEEVVVTAADVDEEDNIVGTASCAIIMVYWDTIVDIALVQVVVATKREISLMRNKFRAYIFKLYTYHHKVMILRKEPSQIVRLYTGIVSAENGRITLG